MKQQVSISRLHKLADRLKTKVSELTSEATTSLGAQSWRTGPVTQAQLNRAAAQAEAGLATLRDAERLARELARIRGIVATQNERLGINIKLGTQEALTRQLTALKGLQAAGGAQLRDEMEAGQATGDYGTTVCPLASGQVAFIKTEVARLQREIFGLSDEVAEANATRVELELSDDVAALITG